MDQYFMNIIEPGEREKVRRLNTLMELEQLCLKEYGELFAVQMKDIKITYNQLWQKVALTRTGLIEAGLEKGDRIGIALPNTPDAVVCFLAVVTAGGVAAMLPAAKSIPSRKRRSLATPAGASVLSAVGSV